MTTTTLSPSDSVVDQHEVHKIHPSTFYSKVMLLIQCCCFFIKCLQKRIEEEINQLMIDIRRIGEVGSPEVTFGELFDDDHVQQYYEALVGTLKCAKKRGLIDYKGILLLKGVNDNVVISIRDAEASQKTIDIARK